MNSCKGICQKFKAKTYRGKSRYEDGQRRCQTCTIFLKWSKNRCPCCNSLLRITPRANNSRKTLRKKRNFVWI
ncbi:MAG: hypothetical protein DWQ18_03525 [Crenarchaeota archaeon]|nr:MAG: hypothetical protein DWQ17_09605 [Thermoproteota archaeon]RDJ33984.1 MAG: hypothetical protein DWQ18_03525 [Thermoproteota archaeon]RDJ36901.1 MAG: hypothetical protein DWQ13_07090 [Thermoproteota archaeon]RDJ37564.1 MAG: hypothetical protein DWQ19_03745 [Thermoproteota archaeon]